MCRRRSNVKMGLCPRLPRNLRGAIEPRGDARPHREPLKLQFPTDSPVNLNPSSRANGLITLRVIVIHNLLGSSHELSGMGVYRFPVSFPQLLDGLDKLACSPSPRSLGKCKITAANISASLFPTLRPRCFVFFEV